MHMVWEAPYHGSYPRYGLVDSKHTKDCRPQKHLAMYEKDVGEMYRDDTV